MPPPRASLSLLLGASLLLVSGAGCKGAEGNGNDLTLEVMSINLRWGPDPPPNSWNERRALVLELLRREAPDVIGLQESRDEYVDDLLAAQPVYAAYPERGDRQNAILYRTDRLRLDRETSDAENARVDAPEEDWGIGSVRLPRSARFVEKASGRGFYVYNNHFDHRSAESRAWSAAVLVDRIRRRRIDDPVVLTGDFNATPNAPTMRFLRGESPLGSGRDASSNPIPFVDTWSHRNASAPGSGTFHSFLGIRFGRRVDYVLADPTIRVLAARIHREERDGTYLSDHFPVSATLGLP